MSPETTTGPRSTSEVSTSNRFARWPLAPCSTIGQADMDERMSRVIAFLEWRARGLDLRSWVGAVVTGPIAVTLMIYMVVAGRWAEGLFFAGLVVWFALWICILPLVESRFGRRWEHRAEISQLGRRVRHRRHR